MRSRAFTARTVEQVARVLGTVALCHLFGIWTALLVALLLTVGLSLLASVAFPNGDSPWLLPASCDEPVPAPVDRIDMQVLNLWNADGP